MDRNHCNNKPGLRSRYNYSDISCQISSNILRGHILNILPWLRHNYNISLQPAPVARKGPHLAMHRWRDPPLVGISVCTCNRTQLLHETNYE
jgi:hypothetical protein